MAEVKKTKRSLYLLLGAIIVTAVVAVLGLHGTYNYLTQKQQIIERMEQNSAMSAAILQENIATLIESYAINEYSKLVATEVKLREHFAIIVKDYNMGRIVGEEVYISGVIRDPTGAIIEFDSNDPAHHRWLRNSFHVDETLVVASSGTPLGNISIYMTDDKMKQKLEEILLQSISGTLFISLLLIVLLIITIRRTIVGPLYDIAVVIGQSDNDGIPTAKIPSSPYGEISILTDTINDMRLRLGKSREELRNANELLEERVKTRTHDLHESNLLLQESEECLRSEKEFTESLIQTAKAIILVLDPDGRIVSLNPFMEHLTGYTMTEAVGQDWFTIFLPREDRDQVRELFHETVSGVSANDSIYPIMSKGGAKLDIQWASKALRDKRGRLVGVVSIGLDITERKHAEVERARLQRELQQARKMEALGQLTGGIAHDFNNILGIIMGYSELAMAHSRCNADTKQVGQLECILKASERAKDLVVKMLAFSRNQASNDKPLQLQSILNEDMKMLRPTLPSSIEISIEIEEDTPAIMMDPIQLDQILMNLCINARDAMNGKGNINIRLGWSRDVEGECVTCRKWIEGDWIELSFTDTGSGIVLDELDYIFDPFYTTKDVGKGTGMGLSVIRGIMRYHGGHILVETEIGKGSTFRLLFPPVVEAIAKTPEVDKSSGELPHGQGEHILVLDDEPDLGEYLKDLLESSGYRVTALTSSKKALDLFREKPDEFSILITDQTMPGMTGIELVKAIREIHPAMPVIMNSGFSNKIDAGAAAEMDIRFLEKPVSANCLIQVVAELLGPAE